MSIFKIQGVVQHYAWGGTDFIPDLLDIPNSDNEPYAELWMGSHPRGTAKMEDNGQDLASLIAASPEQTLGTKVAARFDNQLPFLFKILDVNQMLSIQTHPTKKQAEIGFQKEHQAGVPLDAKYRNFKDDNHKPEIMVALTDFWLLHGFQSVEKIEQILQAVKAFAPLRDVFQDKSIRKLYQYVMKLPQSSIDELLQPLQQRLHDEQPMDKSTADYWAHLAFQEYTRDGHFDRGIFSIYLFNLVNIQPDDAIFQAAGIPHAYLEGVNVELMANSDNVFRGGLTPKHIDVPELLAHLNTDPVKPNIFSGTSVSQLEAIYQTPAPDFEVSRIQIQEGDQYTHQSTSAEILIVLAGEVMVQSESVHFERGKGDQFFVSANTNYKLTADNDAILFKARVPG
ncbi:MAG: mannose-6-phosphate isomerase, class I [Bacteroidota bacterium]